MQVAESEPMYSRLFRKNKKPTRPQPRGLRDHSPDYLSTRLGHDLTFGLEVDRIVFRHIGDDLESAANVAGFAAFQCHRQDMDRFAVRGIVTDLQLVIRPLNAADLEGLDPLEDHTAFNFPT